MNEVKVGRGKTVEVGEIFWTADGGRPERHTLERVVSARRSFDEGDTLYLLSGDRIWSQYWCYATEADAAESCRSTAEILTDMAAKWEGYAREAQP